MLLDLEPLKTILEFAPDSILLVDKLGFIRFVNKQVITLFGYEKDELIGQTIELLVPKELRERHVHLRGGYNHKPTLRPMGQERAITGQKKTGEIIPVEISLSPITINNQPYVTAIVRDVTEKKLQQKKLEEKSLELEQFVYIASHNLQEPLKSIEQLIGFLNEEGIETSKEGLMDIYFRIQRASIHMSDLIKDLLIFSRLGRKPELTEVDCNQAVESVKESLKALIEKNQAQVNIIGKLPTLQLYATEFNVLLQNLIDNAVKFHLPNVNPVINIRAEKRDHDYLFSIQDNGIGIEEKFFNKLFFMFQRFQNQKDFPGNGIGLAHCKKVIDIFGGTIWVESTIGKGTTFLFTIPAKIESS